MMHRDRIAAWRDFFEFGSRFFYQDLDLIEFGCGELQKGAHRFTIIFFSVKSIVRDQSSFFINFNDLTFFFSINSPGPLIQRHFISLVQHSFFVKTSIATQFLIPTGYIISAKKKSIYYVPILEFKFQTGKRPSKFNIFANISTISIYTMYILCIKQQFQIMKLINHINFKVRICYEVSQYSRSIDQLFQFLTCPLKYYNWPQMWGTYKIGLELLTELIKIEM